MKNNLIKETIESYKVYHDRCKLLERIAKDSLADFDILLICCFMQDDGLYFAIKTRNDHNPDYYRPIIIKCDVFFRYFEKEYVEGDNIINNLLKRSV